jgi:drug/metabolite transporter (DMT)-like permease
VLFNCVIWSFTTKLDENATRVAGGWTYLTYGKLMTGAWALVGDKLTMDKATKKDDDKEKKAAAAAGPVHLQPKVMLMLLGVACTEGLYMLCYYGAITRVSKVFVVAIKKGGGLLISAAFGVLFFGENVEGRVTPILAIVCGVVLLAV